MVDQPSQVLAAPYDLLESLEDLWWDPVPGHDKRVLLDEEKSHPLLRVLMNVRLPGYIIVPRGSRALCLGFATDMLIPEIDQTYTMKEHRLRCPYLFIDGFPYIYMAVGREHPFDKIFKLVARYEEADGNPSSNS